MPHKRAHLLTFFFVFASATLVAGSYVTLSFRHDEQRLEAFCRDTVTGELLEAIRLCSSQSGLAIEPSKSPRDAGKVFYISHKNPFLQAGSFCSVYTDGKVVTLVSYNPWTH